MIIKELKEMEKLCTENYPDLNYRELIDNSYQEALDLAIKALEKRQRGELKESEE